MIERCPHCHEDVMFTRDICPACGHTSSEDERVEQTDLDARRQEARTPVFDLPFVTAMTVAEQRGRLELSLITVVFLLPDAFCLFVRACELRLDPWVAGLMAVSLLLVRGLWRGSPRARSAATWFSASAGVTQLLAAVCLHPRLPIAHRGLLWGSGCLLLLVAWPLWRSTDLTDYQRRLRHAASAV